MSASPTPVGVIAGVYVGRPRTIGQVRGRPVASAIAKQPVVEPQIELGDINLAGDDQADRSVHGGPDKAVYVYARDHYPTWQRDGFAVEPGGLGENVSLTGVTERDVLLGDVWRWGEAMVQVSQPRSPCYKLSIHTARRDIGRRMIETRRCGWYLRVLQTGTVPTRGGVELHDRDEDAPSVHDMFAAMFAGHDDAHGDAVDAEVVDRMLRSPALAEAWRTPLLARRQGAPR